MSAPTTPIPTVENMFCNVCDENPMQTILTKENLILCGFCGEEMYNFTEADRVKDWDVGWSQELKDVMNGVSELSTTITRLEKNGDEEE